MPEIKCFTHALDYEKQHGFHDIGTQYALPPRWKSLQEFDIAIRAKHQEKAVEFCEKPWWISPQRAKQRGAATLKALNPVLDEIKAMNPSLNAVHYNREDLGEVWSVICGVASGFNPSDINYFLERSIHKKIPPAQDTQHMKQVDEFSDKVSARYTPAQLEEMATRYVSKITWIPSPETLAKMQRQQLQKEMAPHESTSMPGGATSYVTAREEGDIPSPKGTTR